MSDGLVNILSGNTFVVSNAAGDIDASPTVPNGYFSFDSRFLSKWILTVDGQRLSALSTDDLQYYEARFFLVPGAPAHYVDSTVSVIRHRWIGQSFHERILVLNHGEETAHSTVRIEVDADFADIFEIKGQPHTRGKRYSRVDEGLLRVGYTRDTFRRESLITSSEPAQVDFHGLSFNIEIEPHGRWETELRVQASMPSPEGRDLRAGLRHYDRPAQKMLQDLEDWLDRAPQLDCDSPALTKIYHRSLVDLDALRFVPLSTEGRTLPAAGLPWFMSVFGRDSLLTSFQVLPFVPEYAVGTLQLLASLQGSRLDDFRDEEPGKMLHEIRYGETAAFREQPHSPYYGAADSTPLWIILLDEYERWTGDAELVRELEHEARDALTWIDTYGNIMGDGYLWYQRRNETTGLDNQCWKDSWDSISYHDGRLAGLPRATCELQGYAYDAKIRAARLARHLWNDPPFAERLEREAADLKARFNHDFWISEREQYAFALDGSNGARVDALSSNIGHLLWSGIVDEARAPGVAQHLLGPRLFSGWGIRTLAQDAGRYNPIGYHNGTVWPFDNSFTAMGLRRYGFHDEAARIAQSMFDAAEYFDGRLPEAIAGYERSLTKYPVQYPTACSPQAWSSGAPLLLLRTILGLNAEADHLIEDPALPPSLTRIELLGVPGRWGRADAFGRNKDTCDNSGHKRPPRT